MSLYKDHLSSKLTEPNKLLGAQARMTQPGQAHFAGTGPANMTCRQCEHWDHKSYEYRSKSGKFRGLIKPACCRKFKALTGMSGAPVPDDAPACKYFEWNLAHPRRFARDD